MEIKNNDNSYILPDFLIVGAAKSGTTAIAKFLENIKTVFIPKMKECRFFSGMKGDFNGPGDDYVNKRVIHKIENYSLLFEKNKDKFCGDASPDYLFYSRETVKNIKKYYPQGKEPKIIIILRNPLDRAFSMYQHLKRDLREKESFAKGVSLEKERENKNWEWVWLYSKASMYFKSVNHFLTNFEKDKVEVFIYDDFVKDPKEFMRSIYTFLNLDVKEDNNDYSSKFNVSGDVKFKLLQKIIVNRSFFKEFIASILSDNIKQKIKQLNVVKKKKKISHEKELELKSFFIQDIEKLETLLEIDLKNWK